MEFFRSSNIDWLGKKWYFLAFSLIFSVAGVLSMAFWNHIPLGVDFKGGTNIRVSFSAAPNEDHIHAAFDHAGVHNATTQRTSSPTGQPVNEEIISLPISSTDTGSDVGGSR